MNSQTAAAIEVAREAIAERLGAIGQPLGTFIIQQTGPTDGTTNANTMSRDDGQKPQGRGDRGDLRGGRRRFFWLLATAEAGSMACEREMARAARNSGVPLNVLYSVGLTETGHRGELGPYDMNVDGREVHSDTLPAAMARFAAARAKGAKFIDVGCMQINVRFHGQRFISVAQMFDPALNVGYAASFLKTLRAQEGNWTVAVARYNAGPGKSRGRARLCLCGNPQHCGERIRPMDGRCPIALPVKLKVPN